MAREPARSALGLFLLTCSAYAEVAAFCPDGAVAASCEEDNDVSNLLQQRKIGHPIILPGSRAELPVSSISVSSRPSLNLPARAAVSPHASSSTPPSLAHPPPPTHDSQHNTPINPRRGELEIDYIFQGCYPRSSDDAKDEPVYMDTTCIDWNKTTPCRSGMPFYRLRLMKGQSVIDCAYFCLSKGLDLSGVIMIEKSEGEECRCGATANNTHAWHLLSPPPAFQLPSTRLELEDPNCRLLVWRYTGGLEQGNHVPYPLLAMGQNDARYMDSIGERHVVDNLEDSPSPTTQPNVAMVSTAAVAKARGLCNDAKHTGVYNGAGQELSCSELTGYCTQSGSTARYVKGACPLSCGQCSPEGGFTSCYPSQCAGGIPWTKASDGKVYIPYYFDSNIDKDRREVLLTAFLEYGALTCIRFFESTTRPCLRVSITNVDGCSATIGNPGEGKEAVLNMGWCKAMQDVGSVIHELGHIIGMLHEQNRIDAAQTMTVKGANGGTFGPYLKVYWHNIPQGWESQYLPDVKSYVGSNSQGPGDPHDGYAHYDYGSIMQYSSGDPTKITALHNEILNSIMGQRAGLSPGDVNQISDMYQCPVENEHTTPPAPTPPAPTTQVPTTSVPPENPPSDCKDTDPPDMTCDGKQCTCEFLKKHGYCADKTAIGDYTRKYCVKSCERCVTDPVCQDSSPIWMCDNSPCTCEWLEANRYCSDPTIGSAVRTFCEKTCGVCEPSPSQTTKTRTTTSTTSSLASACTDTDPVFMTCNGEQCTCDFLTKYQYCTDMTEIGDYTRQYCPRSCGLCVIDTCKDGTPNWMCDNSLCTCKWLATNDYCYDSTIGSRVRFVCPKSCGQC